MKKCPFCAEEIQDEAIVCKHCGRDLPGEKTAPAKQPDLNQPATPKQIAIGCLVLIGILVVYFAACPSGDRSSTSSSSSDAVAAWSMAQQFVEDRLKSPASAKFPWYDKDSVRKSGSVWVVSSYVDSQNSFGATIRTHFTIHLEPKNDANGTWNMRKLIFDGKQVYP